MGRITSDLQQLTGSSQTAMQAMDQAMAARSAAAKPLYDKAMQFDPTTNPHVLGAWQSATADGWGKAALNSATLKRNMASEYGIKDLTGPPTMAVVDGWKRSMDDLANAQARAGNNNSARLIAQQRDMVVGALDDPIGNPAYSQGRAAWAQPSQYMDAVEAGKAIGNRNLSSEEFGAQFAKLTPAEQEAQRIGAVTSIVAKMGSDPAKMGDMTKYLRSPEMRAKIAALMPDADSAARWTQILDHEVKSSELSGKALGNSATARRLAEQQDAGGLPGDLIREGLGMMMSGHVGGGGIVRAISSAPKAIRDTARSRSDKIVAQQLVQPGHLNPLLDFLGPDHSAPPRIVSNEMLRFMSGANQGDPTRRRSP